MEKKMKKQNNKHSRLFKTIAIGLVCLFLVNATFPGFLFAEISNAAVSALATGTVGDRIRKSSELRTITEVLTIHINETAEEAKSPEHHLELLRARVEKMRGVVVSVDRSEKGFAFRFTDGAIITIPCTSPFNMPKTAKVTVERTNNLETVSGGDEEREAGSEPPTDLLIGHYRLVTGTPHAGIEFVPYEKGDPGYGGEWDGCICFNAYDIRHPAEDQRRKRVAVWIRAKRVPADQEVFENYAKDITPGMNDRLSDTVNRVDADSRFILDPNNRFGIYGIGTYHMLGIAAPIKNNRTALWHEVTHAARIKPEELVQHIEGKQDAFDDFLEARKTVQDEEYRGFDDGYREAARGHYACVQLQEQKRPGENKALKEVIDDLEKKRLSKRRVKKVFVDVRPWGGSSKEQRDLLPEIVALDEVCSESPWSEADFIRYFADIKNCVRCVAVYKGRIVGYMFYNLHKGYLELGRIAVHPKFRHMNVGQALIGNMCAHLEELGRTRVTVEVAKTDIATQRFLYEMGFRDVVVEDDSAMGDDDTINMEFTYGAPYIRQRVPEMAVAVPGPGVAAGRYEILPDQNVEFYMVDAGKKEGYLEFNACHTDDPERKRVLIRIDAQQAKADTVEDSGEGTRFLLEPNPYGINHIDLPGLLAVPRGPEWAGIGEHYRQYLDQSMSFVKEFVVDTRKPKCLRVPVEALWNDEAEVKYIQALQQKGVIIELYYSSGKEKVAEDVYGKFFGLEYQARPEGVRTVTLALEGGCTSINDDEDYKKVTGGLNPSETILVPVSLNEPATLVRGSIFGFRLLDMVNSDEEPDSQFLQDTIDQHQALLKGIKSGKESEFTFELLLGMVKAIKAGDSLRIGTFITFLLEDVSDFPEYPLEIEHRIYEHTAIEVSA